MKERVTLMYLKRIDGPRAVTLPDGTVLSLADLPPASTRRWVASRKAVVVRAVEHGLIPRSEALRRYDLSDEEFDAWERAILLHGTDGLKVTALQKYRQLER
jgi:chorismate-pyruvate lyase